MVMYKDPKDIPDSYYEKRGLREKDLMKNRLAVSQAAAFVKTIQERGIRYERKGEPTSQIIRNVNDAVVVVLFLAMTITVIIQVFSVL